MNARGPRSAKPKRRTKRADLPRRPSSIRNGACRPKRSAAPRNRRKCKPNGQKCKRTRQTGQPNRTAPSQPRGRHARRTRPTPPRQPHCLSRRHPEPMPSVYGKLLSKGKRRRSSFASDCAEKKKKKKKKRRTREHRQRDITEC